MTSDEARRDQEALSTMRALVGKPIGPPSVAPDPVNQPMIRHWAAALEDHNPVYTDPAFAASSRFGAIVAPPLMLQTWTMATPKISGIAERGGSPVEGGQNPLTPLDEAGFIATLATNSEFEVVRYLRLGETITATTIFESISDRKQTRLGPGHFVTWVTTYTDERGEVVGRQMFRMLKFKPDLEALLK
jgi:acyl dehydratase